MMDESTSALDTRNERLLYQALRGAGGWAEGAVMREAWYGGVVVWWCGGVGYS